jgi:glycosyltransferase involved in cell wall biosynthesis
MLPSVYAVGMVKDEEDIIGDTITNLLGWGVEHVVVADNGSTDGTGKILAYLAAATKRVTIIRDDDPAYYQSRKMTTLAHYAGDLGAEWIVPFDADELWGVVRSAPIGMEIPEALAATPDTAMWAEVGMKNHYCTGFDADLELVPSRRMTWRHLTPNPLPKIAFRYRPSAVVGMGNHEVWYVDQPDAIGFPTPHLEIRHFPYRSEEQFVRKARNGAAAYAATDLDPMYGAHWRGYGALLDSDGEEALRAVFREHFFYDDPPNQGMALDPAPIAPGLWLA